MTEKKIVGYTAGVFDLLHIGHINILRNAKGSCDFLIVGVTTDELALSEKGVKPEISFEDRIATIQALKFCDAAIPQDTYDKFELWKKLRFDVMFVGDDWYGKWQKWEEKFKEVGVKIVYFPHTPRITSTQRRERLKK
ncbi:MAG: adenylyltransferase/cytidyltransferase family protein [Candidatus Aenigmatarchaeota archaeon]